MPKAYSSQAGFSLIEFIMVIVLLAIVAKASSVMLAQGFNAFIATQRITEADWQGRVAVARLTRDLQALRSSNDISTASSNQLVFTDIDGNSIDYQLSGNTLNRSGIALADGISSLTFSYFDLNGNTTAITTAIRYIDFSVTVTKNNSNYTVSTRLFLRNSIP